MVRDLICGCTCALEQACHNANKWKQWEILLCQPPSFIWASFWCLWASDRWYELNNWTTAKNKLGWAILSIAFADILAILSVTTYITCYSLIFLMQASTHVNMYSLVWPLNSVINRLNEARAQLATHKQVHYTHMLLVSSPISQYTATIDI